MKPHITLESNKAWYGKYWRLAYELGIGYFQENFEWEDKYREIRISLIFFRISIGFRTDGLRAK